MLSGVINTAFSYITASANDTGQTTLSQSRVSCSTADDGAGKEKSTAMSTTNFTGIGRRFMLQGSRHHHEQCKGVTLEPRPQYTTGLLHHLLQLDEYLTGSIGFCANPRTTFQHAVSNCCRVLEISGHGVPWFLVCAFVLLSYLYIGDIILFEYGINMLVVLLVDLLVVAPMKLLFKRPRPHLNIGKIPLSVSKVDKYAFPSGHASRCVALAAYFCYMPPFNPWTHLWYIWGLLVSLSRIALGRHHVLDVGAGMLAGLLIFELVRRSGMLYGV